MNKLIIIYRNHFTLKEFEKLNLDSYLKKNIFVEVWVMNKLLKDKVIFSNMKNKKKLKIQNISNIKVLENKIKSQQNRNTVYQIDLKFELKSIKIFKLITKYDCTYLISPGLTVFNEKNIKKKFSILIKRLFILDINYVFKILFNKINNIFNKIMFKIKINFFDLKKADFFYCRAKKYFEHNKNHYLISKKTKIIWGHQKDYEFFLKNKKTYVKKINKKILFLDQNVPYHSDLVALGVADVNPKKYYNSINNFLERMSNKFKIKTHICCHPRADMKKLKKFFPKISLSQGDTIQQIKNAKCLLVHDSTALNLGVLYSKPIIYIINDALIQSKWHHSSEVKIAAMKLKKNIYNIDFEEKQIFKNLKDELKVNHHNYWIFVKNYIKYKGTNNNSAEETINKLRQYKFWK